MSVPEQVLVTGGAGFIGSHTVERLLAEGARITVLDDFSSGRRANLPAAHARLRITEGDIRGSAMLPARLRTILAPDPLTPLDLGLAALFVP